MENMSDLDIGTAGEYLVCADLILSGYRAFLTSQTCPYDVAVEVDGKLIRVQVKTTRGKRPIPQRVKHTPAYLFHVRRCGKGGRKNYDENDFDVLALVALDIRKIAYVSLQTARQTMHINEGKFLELSSFENTLR